MRIAKDLVDNGFDVTVGLGDEISQDSNKYRGLKFIKLPIQRRGSIFEFISSIFRTKSILKNESFDYINIHTPSAAFLIRWASIFQIKTKIIYTVHGFYFHENMDFIKKIIHIFSEFILSFRTSKFILVSKEDTIFIKKLLFFRKKIDFYFAPNKIDADTYSFNQIKRKIYRSKIYIEDEIYLFGMVCRINPEKGIIEFLSAAVELLKINSNCHFIVVGDLMNEENTDEFINSFNNFKQLLGNKLDITGFVNDVDGYLSAIDVFCLPSYREGYPVSFIEASVAGCYCIASNIRGCREIAKENSNSTLIKSRSTNQLQKAMKTIILDSSILESDRESHSEKMSTKFNLSNDQSLQSIIIKNIIKGV